MKIQQSAEDYLESILMLSKTNPVVRSIDVANDLGFSKPSVSVAMKNLREGGYISMSKEGYITLLEPGLQIAEKIYERHTTLTKLFSALGVPEKLAAEDACRVEHDLSPESFAALKSLAEMLTQ
ncbi:metal-dependent transcriptional regulator [[Clostridium] aminophilum]|uniref:Iron (Metal) dependent repressor, DtxR family n=1 Tax=[Clostridium] aminophilum TaxID=1526 RepID=A0A1I0ALY6_9FIRM|nr:metal-dependent transcriptional regulator [[Clostridium] aminophilum]MDD6196018.1 metal-dependent transcriptional regulator [[Clostridium] aminophilum]SES95309.1 iron (metal) dependent repressor, DtxR family [[Clostridium] aminophilum]